MVGRTAKPVKHLIMLSVGVLAFASIANIARGHDKIPTPTPSATPINLLTSHRTLEAIQTLMLADDDCTLPCFWGFVPGETALAHVEESVHSNLDADLIADVDSSSQVVWRTLTVESRITALFTFEDNTLSLITAYLYEPYEWLPENRFELQHFLTEMDSTPDVYIGINSVTQLFFVVVIYNDADVMAEYAFEFKDDQFTETNSPIQLCLLPQQNLRTTIWLQDQDFYELVENQIFPTSPPGTIRSSDYYKSVEFNTGIDTEIFIEGLIKNPDDCVEAFSYVELRDRGYEF
jgi:hypothetical protein